MTVVLDTTEVMRDRFCRGPAWRVLAHAAARWGVQIVVSDVVMEEAIANQERDLGEALGLLEQHAAKRKYEALGISAVVESAREHVRAAAEAYPTDLRQRLAAAGVSFIAPPHVSPMELVRRSTKRQRPCNAQGDGFRDTLNWLTVMEMARDNPSMDVVWVSDNVADFAESGDEASPTLHEDLRRELATLGLEERVRLVRTLPDLVLELARSRGSEAVDLHALHRRVQQETVLAFLGRLLREALPIEVDPRRCGLPVDTKFGQITAVSVLGDLNLKIQGDVSGAGVEDTVAADFSVNAEVELRVDPPYYPTTSATLPASSATDRVIKSLRFRGLLTLDRYQRPRDAELTRIEAPGDDPGRVAWSTADLTRSYRRILDVVNGATVPFGRSIAELQSALSTSYATNVGDLARAMSGATAPLGRSIAELQSALSTSYATNAGDLARAMSGATAALGRSIAELQSALSTSYATNVGDLARAMSGATAPLENMAQIQAALISSYTAGASASLVSALALGGGAPSDAPTPGSNPGEPGEAEGAEGGEDPQRP